MSRIHTMSRFDEKICTDVPRGFCACCNEPLYVGYAVVRFDIELFCDLDCFHKHMDVKTIILKGEGVS